MKEKGIFKLEKVSVRLVKEAPLLSSVPINSPQKAVELLGQELSEMDREVVCLINLTHDMKPINCHILSIGSLNQAVVHPRELYKSSILSNAAHIILLHSHPSGNLTPSKEDIQLTTGLRKISELIQIPLLDHIIVGGGNGTEFFSMVDRGIFPEVSKQFQTTMVAEHMREAEHISTGRGR